MTYSFSIKLADIPIKVTVSDKNTLSFCREYLCDEKDIGVNISICDEDIAFERKLFEERNSLDSKNNKYCLYEISALYRKIAEVMISYDILLIHGSALAIEENGVLFIAPSGTGKSTHARLWREMFGDRVEMINDDKPLLKISDRELKLYGTPWNGKHRLGKNISAPLKAVYKIERGEKNSIRKLERSEALSQLISQTYRSSEPEKLKRTIALLDIVTKKVPVFILTCTMDTEAVMTAYNAVFNESK